MFETETLWPINPKIFNISPFTEEVCSLCSTSCLSEAPVCMTEDMKNTVAIFATQGRMGTPVTGEMLSEDSWLPGELLKECILHN